MDDEDEKPKIEASFIIEMLGRPKEHLEDTLKRLVEKLNTESGAEVVDKKFHEARLVEDKRSDEEKVKEKEIMEKTGGKFESTNELYTTFAEVDVKFDNLESLVLVSFNYMPSNLQITKPETFVMRNSDIDGILTNIILRLHRYDEVAKKLSFEKSLIEGKLKEIMGKKGD